MELRWCPACRDERMMEQPPCLDGHGECPEWACLACGTAVVAGWFEIDAPVHRSAAGAAA